LNVFAWNCRDHNFCCDLYFVFVLYCIVLFVIVSSPSKKTSYYRARKQFTQFGNFFTIWELFHPSQYFSTKLRFPGIKSIFNLVIQQCVTKRHSATSVELFCLFVYYTHECAAMPNFLKPVKRRNESKIVPFAVFLQYQAICLMYTWCSK